MWWVGATSQFTIHIALYTACLQVMGYITDAQIDSPFNPSRASTETAVANNERVLKIEFSVSDDVQTEKIGE